MNNYVVLAKGDKMSVVIDFNDIKNDKRNFKAMCGNTIYEPDFGFITHEYRKKPLNAVVADEYATLLGKAHKEFDRLSQEIQLRQQPEKLDLMGAMQKALADAITQKTSDEILETVMPDVRQRIIEEFGILPQKHEIITQTEHKTLNGIFHEKFDLVLNLVSSDIPTFLTGAAGTGKNVLCKQIAEALDLDFYFTNAVTQEYKLTGFIDANGHYHETEFYKAFKNGGLFFLDEMDASIPETLIVLNAAIANRYFDFPNGKIEAHKDFRVIAAGNTYGTGADIEYSGRYQLDAASLDRFALVEIDYSKNIENALSLNDNALVEFAEEFRKATKHAGIKHLVTYRAIERVAKLKDVLPLSEALKIALIKNLEKDDIQIILNSCENTNNKYYVATKELIRSE